MKYVNYAKLAEEYGVFLVAVGGVSITVLALVLGLGSKTEPLDQAGKTAREFLVAALITATVSCFIGAHMMAETAAFFMQNRDEQLGRRLFVLATTNIFIAITLVLFSIVLLPKATGEVALANSLKWISVTVFLGVVLGALLWMALAAIERMGVGHWSWLAIGFALVAGFVTLIFCYESQELWLKRTFIFIGACTALSLLYFAVIFRIGRGFNKIFTIIEIGVFSSAITISYAFLIVACLKILLSGYSSETNASASRSLGKPANGREETEKTVGLAQRKPYAIIISVKRRPTT